MRLIDSHHHFFELDDDAYPWMTGRWAPLRRRFGPEDLEPLLARARVNGTILIQTQPNLDETERFLGLAASIPWIQGVVGWVELTEPDLAETLLALSEKEGGRFLVGVRHDLIDEANPDWLSQPDVRRGLETIASFGLAFDLLIRERNLDSALAAAVAIPELRFVVDHLAKPDIRSQPSSTWLNIMRRLGALENVACKLSGLATEGDWQHWKPEDLAPFVAYALSSFSPERCMFGSDWPVSSMAASYEELVSATRDLISELATSEQEDVLAQTAINWYGLS
jgi:L-fuconolactonase